MIEDEDLDLFLELMEQTSCSEYLDFIDLLEGIGFFIPFLTTIGYLSHPESRKNLKLKDYTKLKN